MRGWNFKGGDATICSGRSTIAEPQTEHSPRLIDGLFRRLTLRRFFDEYYLRLPIAMSELPADVRELGAWSTFEAILARPDADLLVVRAGERHPDTTGWTVEKCRAAAAEGFTIVVRHAERNDSRLEALAREFGRLFSGRVDIHLYCTPAPQFGFGWHYDAEEVFILQTTGDKTYSLRKNTVNPWPIEETLPADMRYDREIMPISRCRLTGGDWLYIPSGYWHMGRADAESISLAVGVTPRTGFDVLNVLRGRLLDSPLWRRRFIPPNAWEDPAAMRAAYETAIDELAADFVRTARRAGFVDAFIKSLVDEDG